MLSEVSDLKSSDLGGKLSDALIKIQKCPKSVNGSIVFIGMDSPTIPCNAILDAASQAAGESLNGDSKIIPKSSSRAVIFPAIDGGYTLLALPPRCPIEVFERVAWSQPITCISQQDALRRNGITDIVVGDTFPDIDEPEDLKYLAVNYFLNADQSGIRPSVTTELPHLSEFIFRRMDLFTSE